MTSATIKLFIPRGDAKSLRAAEISNWTGKAVAAPRTELDELLAREEVNRAGIYILTGSANGLITWKTEDGKSLKQLDEQA
jgi:hypothetical protein